MPKAQEPDLHLGVADVALVDGLPGKVSLLASTRVLGPNRSMTGGGALVPSSVTVISQWPLAWFSSDMDRLPCSPRSLTEPAAERRKRRRACSPELESARAACWPALCAGRRAAEGRGLRWRGAKRPRQRPRSAARPAPESCEVPESTIAGRVS